VDVPRALDLYQRGRLKIDELATRRYHLDEINEALEALRLGTGGRGVIAFD
jgi:Zn-dependent alcohol dehydrogenase